MRPAASEADPGPGGAARGTDPEQDLTGLRGLVRRVLYSSAGALLVVSIMFIGSLVLWVGTPLLWLWVGSRLQGVTGSLGAAVGAMFLGVVVTIVLLAVSLVELSGVYRRNQHVRGLEDPRYSVLERVLVISAGIAIAGFAFWFFFLAGANPVPIGIQI